MNKIPTKIPPSKLNGFIDYRDFMLFAKTLFNLDANEYRGMFNVLVKLQSVGEDPIQTMLFWKNNTDEQDCHDMIRFMIQVECMDLEAFQKAA